LTKFISSEFLRYLIVGGTNTAITYGLYLLLLLVMPYSAAYTVEYLLGIAISYYLNSRFVFHQPLHWKKAFQFPLVYIVQYMSGIALLSLSVEVLHINAEIAPLLVIAFTIPLTFVLSRLIIKGRQPVSPA
jgi:putative flippase GtrA